MFNIIIMGACNAKLTLTDEVAVMVAKANNGRVFQRDNTERWRSLYRTPAIGREAHRLYEVMNGRIK